MSSIFTLFFLIIKQRLVSVGLDGLEVFKYAENQVFNGSSNEII